MKNFIQRIAAVVIIVSFFLPWFDFKIETISGFELITFISGDGHPLIADQDTTLFAILNIIILVAGIILLFKPLVLPTILVLIAGTIIPLAFFTTEVVDSFTGPGIYVLAAGVVVMFVSLFIKQKPV